MRAPTSVSAICLMRDHKLCFSIPPSLPGFIAGNLSPLSEAETPARQPLTGERKHTDTKQPEPVSCGAPSSRTEHPSLVSLQSSGALEEFVGILLDPDGASSAAQQAIAVLSRREP